MEQEQTKKRVVTQLDSHVKREIADALQAQRYSNNFTLHRTKDKGYVVVLKGWTPSPAKEAELAQVIQRTLGKTVNGMPLHVKFAN